MEPGAPRRAAGPVLLLVTASYDFSGSLLKRDVQAITSRVMDAVEEPTHTTCAR